MSEHSRPAPLVLASASPRRVELMLEAGFAFEVLVPSVEEAHDEALSCEALTVENARLKAAAIAAQRPDALVIGADTLVYLEGFPLGKPLDMEDAAAMLRRLSGHTHQVCTGVAVLSAGGNPGEDLPHHQRCHFQDPDRRGHS